MRISDWSSDVCSSDLVIIRIQYPLEFVQDLEKLFKQTKKIEDLDFLKFGRLIKSNYPLTLTLFKDTTMAKSITEKMLKYPKERSKKMLN